MAPLRLENVRTKPGQRWKIITSGLAGNKCDLDEAEREVQKEEGQKLAEEWGVPFFDSAKTKINDHEVFYEIIREGKYDEAKKKESGRGQPKKKFRCDILQNTATGFSRGRQL